MKNALLTQVGFLIGGILLVSLFSFEIESVLVNHISTSIGYFLGVKQNK